MQKWINGWGYRETDFSLFPIVVEDETQRVWFYNNLNASRVVVGSCETFHHYNVQGVK